MRLSRTLVCCGLVIVVSCAPGAANHEVRVLDLEREPVPPAVSKSVSVIEVAYNVPLPKLPRDSQWLRKVGADQAAQDGLGSRVGWRPGQVNFGLTGRCDWDGDRSAHVIDFDGYDAICSKWHTGLVDVKNGSLHIDGSLGSLSRISSGASREGSIESRQAHKGETQSAQRQLKPCGYSGIFGGLCHAPLLAKIVIVLLAPFCAVGIAWGGWIAGRRKSLGIAIAISSAVAFLAILLAMKDAASCRRLAEYEGCQNTGHDPARNATIVHSAPPLATVSTEHTLDHSQSCREAQP